MPTAPTSTRPARARPARRPARPRRSSSSSSTHSATSRVRRPAGASVLGERIANDPGDLAATGGVPHSPRAVRPGAARNRHHRHRGCDRPDGQAPVRRLLFAGLSVAAAVLVRRRSRSRPPRRRPGPTATARRRRASPSSPTSRPSAVASRSAAIPRATSSTTRRRGAAGRGFQSDGHEPVRAGLRLSDQRPAVRRTLHAHTPPAGLLVVLARLERRVVDLQQHGRLDQQRHCRRVRRLGVLPGTQRRQGVTPRSQSDPAAASGAADVPPGAGCFDEGRPEAEHLDDDLVSEQDRYPDRHVDRDRAWCSRPRTAPAPRPTSQAGGKLPGGDPSHGPSPWPFVIGLAAIGLIGGGAGLVVYQRRRVGGS